MKFKHQLFKLINPWAKWYRVLKVLSVLQLLITFALPFVWQNLDTGIWLLSFALFGFWLSNYALIRMAHYYEPDKKGMSGWVQGLWENLLFLVWLLVFIALVLLFIKVIVLI